MRNAMKRLALAGSLSVIVALAIAKLSAAPVVTPEDKQNLQRLTAAYLSQADALDAINAAYAAYQFGSDVYQQGTMPPLPTGDDVSTMMSGWTKMPAITPATAMSSLTTAAGNALNNISAQQMLQFASTRCGGPGLGSKLAELNTKLNLGMPADIAPRFDGVRDKVCQAIQVFGNLKARYDQLMAIKDNGITLAQRARKHEVEFASHHRTLQGGFTLVWKPTLQTSVITGGIDDLDLQFNTWFQYSSENPKPLNLLQRLQSLKANNKPCEGFPFVLDDTMTLKIQVTNSTASSATVEACLKFHFLSETKDLGLGSITVPAPFGYLAEVEAMKDQAKQNMANKVISQIAGMFTQEQQGHIQKLYNLIVTLQGAM